MTKHVLNDKERFLTHVEKTDGCWLWRASKFGSGYGQFKTRRPVRNWRAHRYAYLAFIGPIPEGLTLDHLCRTPACVNPAHLEPVTMEENWRRRPRKKLCSRGHERLPDSRRCKICSISYIPSRLPEARRAERLRRMAKAQHA